MKYKRVVMILVALLLILLLTIIVVYRLKVVDSVKREFKYDSSLNVSKDLQEILYYAELAPSSHNAQMWKIRISKDQDEQKELQVVLDKKRVLKEVDSKNREAYISLGTFVENMVEAAGAKGYKAEVHLSSKPADDKIITIYMNKNSKSKEGKAILGFIRNRCTVRKGFSRRVLKKQNFEELKAIDANNIYYFPIESDKGDYIERSLIKANIQQANNEKEQKEFSNYVRFTREDANNNKSGVTPAGMGLSGVKRFFVSVFMNKDSVMSKSFIDSTAATVENQVKNCSGFIVVTSKDNSFAGLNDSGRTLERLWLETEKYGIAVHPMSQLMEERPWKDEINQKLQINAPIQMVLRIGYYDKQEKPTSERFNLKDIIEN